MQQLQWAVWPMGSPLGSPMSRSSKWWRPHSQQCTEVERVYLLHCSMILCFFDLTYELLRANDGLRSRLQWAVWPMGSFLGSPLSHSSKWWRPHSQQCTGVEGVYLCTVPTSFVWSGVQGLWLCCITTWSLELLRANDGLRSHETKLTSRVLYLQAGLNDHSLNSRLLIFFSSGQRNLTKSFIMNQYSTNDKNCIEILIKHCFRPCDILALLTMVKKDAFQDAYTP